MNQPQRTTFQIVIEGIELPSDTVDRLNEVLQRAALAEIATVDLRGNELTFRPVMNELLASDEGGGGGGGGGGGAHLIVATRR